MGRSHKTFENKHLQRCDSQRIVEHGRDLEKMLYDNALLSRLGAHVWQATQDPEVRRVTEETIDWVAREMTAPSGGFFSSLDADSEGREGAFYVWSRDELDKALGEAHAVVTTYWGVADEPNFEE